MANSRKSLLLKSQNLNEIAAVINELQVNQTYTVDENDPLIKDGTFVKDTAVITVDNAVTDFFEVAKFDIFKELGEKFYYVVVNFFGDIA